MRTNTPAVDTRPYFSRFCPSVCALCCMRIAKNRGGDEANIMQDGYQLLLTWHGFSEWVQYQGLCWVYEGKFCCEEVEACILCYCHWSCTWTEQCESKMRCWSCRTDWESSSSVSLDGIWFWNDSYNWRIWGLNWEEADAYCSYQEQKKHDVQMAFAKNVQALTSVIEELGNPFCESKCDLLVLESRTMQTPCRHSNCRRAWCVRLRNLDLSSIRLTLKRDWSAKQRLSLIHWNTTICPYLVDLQSDKSQASNYRCQH